MGEHYVFKIHHRKNVLKMVYRAKGVRGEIFKGKHCIPRFIVLLQEKKMGLFLTSLCQRDGHGGPQNGLLPITDDKINCLQCTLTLPLVILRVSLNTCRRKYRHHFVSNKESSYYAAILRRDINF